MDAPARRERADRFDLDGRRGLHVDVRLRPGGARMTATATRPPLPPDRVSELRDRIYDVGFVGLTGAFDTEWVDQLDADVRAAFDEALARPHGALGRGPNRYYVEIHPEQIR